MLTGPPSPSASCHSSPFAKGRQLKVYSRQDDGHRSSYVDFACRTFGAKRIGEAELLSEKDILLFLMIEEGFGRYVFTALARSLTGRRTMGLLFQPLPCVSNPNLKRLVKQWSLRLLRRLPRISTLTILPHDLHPGFSRIADGSIHDFQFWDLPERDVERVRALREQFAVEILPETEAPPCTEDVLDLAPLTHHIRELSGGRMVIVALGGLNRLKGFDALASQYIANPALQHAAFVAAGGEVAAESTKVGHDLRNAGAWLPDRFLTDEEMLALYAAADAVWCCYSQDYDQASGILGRAMQLGVPVIVRAGSLNHRLCEMVEYPHLAINGDDLKQSLSRLPPPLSRKSASQLVERFRNESLLALAKAFEGGSVCRTDSCDEVASTTHNADRADQMTPLVTRDVEGR